jgi:DNA replication initiation complex subunit (GINS family)
MATDLLKQDALRRLQESERAVTELIKMNSDFKRENGEVAAERDALHVQLIKANNVNEDLQKALQMTRDQLSFAEEKLR